MKQDSKIVVLAYPDTFVTMSKEWICRILPLVGLGTQQYIKAGHAALVLIDGSTGHAQYFDFGRYITAQGIGRVRSARTDAELEIPFRMQLQEGNIQNLEQLLLWLDAHPDKTHGSGRLLASVCNGVDHSRALEYILALQEREEVPYGAFKAAGSNCSRFVADTILASVSDRAVIRALRNNKRFTPSTVGNVEKAGSGQIYQVLEQQIQLFKGSALKENLVNYFDKRPKGLQQKDFPAVPNAQKLSGTGSGAWFQWVKALPGHSGLHRIRRYNDAGILDYDGVYHSEAFDPGQPFNFTYQSHCLFCHVVQNGKKIKLRGMGSWDAFNSSQKMRSA